MDQQTNKQLAAAVARGKARIAALSAELTHLTERLAALRSERTQLILQVAHAEMVLAWRSRAGVAHGDVFADLDAIDFTLGRLIGVEVAGEVLVITVRLRDGARVRVLFSGAPSATDLAQLMAYARRGVECSGIVMDGDGYRLLLIEGDALLTDACLLAGDPLAVQRVSEDADAATY